MAVGTMRKKRPAQQVPGTSRSVVEGDPMQMRKLRCPGCQQLTSVSQDAQGKSVAKCSCGRTFSSRPM